MSDSPPSALGSEAQKVILFILFVPSSDRTGTTPIDQPYWVNEALLLFGTIFGGATAMPAANGVWRDDDAAGNLVFETPVLVHSYATELDANARERLDRLGNFCRRLLRDTGQGEVGLIVDNVYHAFR